MPGVQGGRRFSGLGVGCAFAIWDPFTVREPDKATETWTWSTLTEVLSYRRWAWVCHIGPFPARAPDSRPTPHAPRPTPHLVGVNLLGRNLHGSRIAWSCRACAGHAVFLFRDGLERQAGECDFLLEFTCRPELALGAARKSGLNRICQNGLNVLLRATVRPQKRDSSAITSGVAALKSAESTPERDCPGLCQQLC